MTALRLNVLAELDTMIPAARTLYPVRQEYRPSLRPTLVPTSGASWEPTSDTHLKRADAAPPTQRSAHLDPRVEAAARAEAYSLLAVMRMNADFLGTLIGGSDSMVAREALGDLQRGIDRLERRFALSGSILPRR
ncbi:MAG: hypothetical protein JWP97_965 [Labilithrix sp.]|nr:hypothetical protein [Labilithrix sp.]